MTSEDIIRMAREAGFSERDAMGRTAFLGNSYDIERFAALVAAAERSACAKFIEHDYVRQFERPWRDDLSAAIRARGQA